MPQTLSLVFVVAIVNRGKGQKMSELFADAGIKFDLLALGKGTADKKFLSYLGLGETEKDVLFCPMPFELLRTILKNLNEEIHLGKPGKGIAFCITINSIVDAASKIQIQDAPQNQGGIAMEIPHNYDLIIAVTNQGYAHEVMDAAKAAGATGGTILHTRGVGLQKAEKFFGMSIQHEKDMLFILTETQKRQDIMTAITQNAGLQTEAKTITFSLPVNGVAGLPQRNAAAPN
jgi:nitrogen regulatory protein PII